MKVKTARKDCPRCRRCNRELTDPVTVTQGIGPICKKKEQAEARGGKCPSRRKGKGEVVTDPRQLWFPFLSASVS